MGKMTKAEVKTAKNGIKKLRESMKNIMLITGIPTVVALIMLYEAGGYNFTGKGEVVFWACVVIAAIGFLCFIAAGYAIAEYQVSLDKNDSSEGE